MKRVQDKEPIMCVRGRQNIPSLAIIVWHHSASLLMPDSDPRDGFFYLPLTPMLDPYISYSVVYVFMSFGITECIPEVLKLHMRDSDEA